MKQLLFSFVVFLLCSAAAVAAPKDKKPAEPKLIGPGSVLVYTVYEDGAPAYNFIIKITVMGKDGIAFDYGFANGGNGNKGNVYINAEALKSATGLDNYFGSGYKEYFKEQTAVFISKTIFETIQKEGRVEIKLDDNTPDVFTGTLSDTEYFILSTTISRPYAKSEKDFLAIEDYGYEYIDGLKCTTLYSDSGDKTITFWNNPECPIITYMNIGFEIRLNAIF